MTSSKEKNTSPKAARERADKLLVALGLAVSREKALGMIMSGQVRYGDTVVNKAGQLLPEDAVLEVSGPDLPYVSRGGLKLEKALRQFAIDPQGSVCLDIGASTGGFTDCLLQNGARKIYAVDVGYGQLAWVLRQDPRVVNLERCNFRYLEQDAITERIDLAVSDVSFISLKYIFARLPDFLIETGKVIALIKPQFEAGRGKVGKNGVVRDPQTHIEVLRKVQQDGLAANLLLQDLGWSPIKGPKGNIEFISLWRLRQANEDIPEHDFEKIVEEAHRQLTIND